MVNLRFFEETDGGLIELPEWRSSHTAETAKNWLGHMKAGREIKFSTVFRRRRDWATRYNKDMDRYYTADEGSICAYRRIDCGGGRVIISVFEETFERSDDTDMDDANSIGAHPEESFATETTYFIDDACFSEDGDSVYVILKDQKAV